jgi:hypothetical protein
LDYFDENPGCSNTRLGARLLELVSSTDLDDDSKMALVETFTSKPPPQHFAESKPALPLGEFKKPATNDPDELLKHRYLCRGGGLLLVGQTGIGKSSLGLQLAIKWALGQPAFGFEPAKPLKSLVFQAENDSGDIAEMRDGVFNGLNLSEKEQEAAESNIHIKQEDELMGEEFFKMMEGQISSLKPDIIWIDPVLSYLGGDMCSQKDVGDFLRNRLNPLIHRYNCGAVVIHHTNKISNSPDKPITDPAYLGAGSAEWANWSRAILALRKTDVANLFELVAGKRGARLKWKAADGESLSFSKYIGYCKRPDTICWMEMAIAEAEELKAGNGKTAEDVLKQVPQTDLIAKDDLVRTCRQNGIGKNKMADLIAELLDDDQLFEVPVPRLNKRPKLLLSRKPVTLNPPPMLDCWSQNSQGHYTVPNLQN